MGWINNLFRKKQTEKQAVDLNNLDEWLDSQISPVVDLLNDELKKDIALIKNDISMLKSNIIELENSEISQKGHVENKVKSVVLGHRTNYIRLINNFINTLDFPTSINYKTALDFYIKTHSALENFTKESINTYYTVQHLFHKEVDIIAKTIKQLDKHLDSLKLRIDEKNFDVFEQAKHKLKELREKIKLNSNFADLFEKDKQKLESSKQSRIEFVNRLEKLRKSRDYLLYQELIERKKSIESELKSFEAELIQLFSPLERALKKFQKITFEDVNIIGSYLDNPVNALVNDKDFKIISLLLKLKNSVLSDSVELKDRKKEKTIETIDKIDREKLDNFLNSRKEILDRKKQVQEQIDANNSLKLLKEIEYKIEHTTHLIETLKINIDETKKRINNLDIDELKRELEDMLYKITNIKVSVSF